MEVLDDPAVIQKCDPANMRELIHHVPDQMKEAERIGGALVLDDRLGRGISNLVFAGLGGSAIGADFVRSYLAHEFQLPIIVNRHYRLPRFVDEKTLLILSTYSGDTEEVLASFDEGLARKARLLVIASGGEITRRAQSRLIPLIQIPKGLPPRAALAYSVIPLLIALSKIGFPNVYRSEELKETRELLQTLADTRYGISIPLGKNRAKQLAKDMLERYPIIYSAADYFDAVALRWRGQIEENAKALSSHHLFPELTHNELAGWKHPKQLIRQFVVFLLRDSGDHARVQMRMDLAAELIQNSGTKVIQIFSEGKSLLARMFSLICLGDWASFYLAVLYGTDPTPVEAIQKLKRELAKEPVS